MSKLKRDLLLEIGCEEIPARLVESARAQLLERLGLALTQSGIAGKGQAKSWATPRRLAAYFPEILAAQPDKTTTETGPPVSAAYDPEGNPTKAAAGFARKHGVSVRQLQKLKTDKGEYVSVQVHRKGSKAEAILTEVLPQVIEGIEFPRSMRWNHAAPAKFIRPVRWIVALYAGKVVRFSFGDVQSGKITYGHRAISNRRINIARAGQYEAVLKRNGVVADPDKRRGMIASEIKRAVKGGGLRPRRDDDLAEKLCSMCEHPVAIAGDFSEEYLALPEEVLTTVMRHHQNYFSVENKQGGLTPKFVAILDRKADRSGRIREGHEAVLEARFRDAKFFWESDKRVTLENRLPGLERITFQGELGSYGDKIRRMEKLCGFVGEAMVVEGRSADIATDKKRPGGRSADIDRRHADTDTLRRATKLCKSDLTTQLVGELPELQGIAGGLYAGDAGESPETARAIYEHYRPEGPDDLLPTSPEAIALSLTDKLDTLAGCFAVGAIPSGSRDPYGLRRAANGVVRAIAECGLRLDASRLLQQAVEIVCAPEETGKAAKADPAAALRLLSEFMADRVRHYFRDVRGFPYDEVNACMAAGWTDLLDLEARLRATGEIRPTPDFEPVAASFKRIRNILEQAGGLHADNSSELRPDLFEQGIERDLFKEFEDARARVSSLRNAGDYGGALRVIASLRPSVDTYFDNVMVNAPEADVRANRLSFLARMLREFSTIADFSEIVTAKQSV